MIIAVVDAIYAIAYRSLKKSGFEPVTSRYRCDALTNYEAMKPLTWRSGQPVKNGC